MTRTRIGAAVVVAALVIAAVTTGEDDASPRSGAHPDLKYQGDVLIQLAVSDLDRSIAFYRDDMGFRLISRDDGLKWAKLDPGIPGVTIGVGEQVKVSGSGTTSMNFSIADIDAARDHLESRGVKFLGPTLTIPGVVRLADFNDPDGNRIRLAGAAPTGAGR